MFRIKYRVIETKRPLNNLLAVWVTLSIAIFPATFGLISVTAEIENRPIGVLDNPAHGPDIYESEDAYILAYAIGEDESYYYSHKWDNFEIKLKKSTDLETWTDVEIEIDYQYNVPQVSVVQKDGDIFLFYRCNFSDICERIIYKDGRINELVLNDGWGLNYNTWREYFSPTAFVKGDFIYLAYVNNYESGCFVHFIDRKIEIISSEDGIVWSNPEIVAPLPSSQRPENDIDFFMDEEGTSFVATALSNQFQRGVYYGYFLKYFGEDIEMEQYSDERINSISMVKATNGNYYLADDNGLWVSSDGMNWSHRAHSLSLGRRLRQ